MVRVSEGGEMTIYLTNNLFDLFEAIAAVQETYPPALLEDRRDNWLREIERTEAEQHAAEIAADTSWLDSGTQAALGYGDCDLGSRFTISGGDVMELDARTMGDDSELPF
jgi:hypothetical protein